MSAVAITVEGVLRKSFGGAGIPSGMNLYYGMATRAKIVLLTSEMQKEGGLEHWLLVEGMAEHVRIIWSDVVLQSMPAAEERLRQLAEARQLGFDIELVVESDPAVSARLLAGGYNTLTFTHAEYTVAAWRPDARLKVKPWDDLVAQVDREQELRAKDTRKEEER